MAAAQTRRASTPITTRPTVSAVKAIWNVNRDGRMHSSRILHPRRGVRLANYIAMLKIESGDWRIDTENGEIYNRITETPLTFSQYRDK